MLRKTPFIISTLLLATLLSASHVMSQSMTVGVEILGPPPEGGWNRIAYPEGVYEPYASNLPGTHKHTFNITFYNFTSDAGNLLQCRIRMSDGTNLTVNNTVPESNNTVEHLSLTIPSSYDKYVSKLRPWEILNCSIYNGDGVHIYSDTSAYGSPLERRIYVHGNSWTRFDSVDDDAYRASRCFLGIPKRYFNNTHYCDYAGDVAFAVTMSRGMKLEGWCHDGEDGPEQNGDVDCDDIYCRGIPYSCISHDYAGDPFYGVCRNGLCWETKNFGGHDITYHYTRYIRPGGTLKVRIDGGRYSTSRPISYAITGLDGFRLYGSYAATGSHKPVNEEVTQTSYAVEDPTGYYGDIDFVMYLRPENVNPGWNVFSLYMVHYGQDLLIDGIPYYVSENAPSNWDESETMNPIVVKPCGDGLDNDLSYSVDCRDSRCDGEPSGSDCGGGDAVCEYGVESVCHDCFDNDADGRVDCADNNCDGRRGDYFNPGNVCEYGGEGCGSFYPSHCVDGFNNDAEEGVDCMDRTCCWGRGGDSTTQPCPAYEDNDPLWCQDGIDNDFDGHTDCRDYDCGRVQAGGSYMCPYNEAYDVDGVLKPEQCFDSVDNDLDNPSQQYIGPGANIDCADPDCVGMVNPSNPSQECTLTEYDPVIGYNLCDNGIDDDSDEDEGWPGGTDCTDRDCWQKFGVCGPCPSFENFRYDSCGNGVDDDYDGLFGGAADCGDEDCLGEFGGEGSQRCEDVEESCGDGFDNDADGRVDCADPDCAGRTGHEGVACASKESTPALCSDNGDNDGDLRIDCADPDCWGVGECAAMDWTSAPPFDVPYMTPLTRIQPTTAYYSHLERLHVDSPYEIRLKGTGSYDVVVITLGDATDSGAYFPYNASSCVLSGTGALKWVSEQDEVGQIQHRTTYSTPINGFDVTLRCGSLGTEQSNTYPVTITNLEDGAPETAEMSLTSTVYESRGPSVDELEVEPLEGSTVEVPYNGSFDVRAVPSPDDSGISQCYFNISGLTYTTPSECVLRVFENVNDHILSLSASVEDGSGNVGRLQQAQTVEVNVLPAATEMEVENVFLRGGDQLSVRASYVTAESGWFIGDCIIDLMDDDGSELDSYVVPGTAGGNTVTCDVAVAVPGLEDGVHYVRSSATDEDGDTAVSETMRFYVCNSLDSRGDGWDCGLADFDMDGMPDICVLNGSVTTTTSTTTTLPNVTTTTIPEGAESCSAVCGKYYNSDFRCAGDITCTFEDAVWAWAHDDRGDYDCFTVDPENGYCCCQMEGLETTTTLYAPTTTLPPLCTNGVLDPGEEDIDCGGPCPPCQCYNGVQDLGEDGVDCGGPCPPCARDEAGIIVQPRLYIIGAPAYAVVGSNVTFRVVDDEASGRVARLQYSLPNGSTVVTWTDDKGRAYVNSSLLGVWSVNARASGYLPASAIWATIPVVTPVVAVVATTSVLTPLIILLLLLRRWRRRRKGVVASEAVVRALYASDALERYAPVWVTEEAYGNLTEAEAHIRPVKLSDSELSRADRLSQRFDISLEWGKLLVIAEKNKAAKLILEGEFPLKEYNLTEITVLWEELR